MNPYDYKITDLIPQRPPMNLIDSLSFAGEKSARGILAIRESNVFCYKGFMGESGLIEFIAQTAAAYTGYKSLLSRSRVTGGYIAAIKNLEIHELPGVDTTIESEIVIENEIVGFTIITGRVFLGSKLLAECEMRILGSGKE